MRGLRAGLLVLLALAAASALALAAVGGARSGARAPQADALLPDLDPVAPGDITVARALVDGKRRFWLSFSAAAENRGAGPLVIAGERPSADSPQMQATQRLQLPDGTRVAGPPVGTLRYVVDPTHQHWHLTPFMRYELRSASGNRLVAPDAKSGFCLGDRYQAKATRAGEFFTNCGLGDTGLLTLVEGISVGFGDNYEAWRDGQHIDVTGVPAGRYLLVHRVNPSKVIEERSYANNASSALLELAWPNGIEAKPRVRVLAVCSGTARCPG